MTKTRLNNADREAIRDAVILHKFQPVEAALDAEMHALAIQARVKAYGDYLATIEAAPDGAFPTEGHCNLIIGGKRIRLSFGVFPCAVRVFSHHARYEREMLNLTDADPFGKKVMAWAERREEAKGQRSKLKDNVRGTLDAFKTFDDLLAGRPEAERFITARWRQRPDYIANVPAVEIRTLSEALDLPPETEAEAA